MKTNLQNDFRWRISTCFCLFYPTFSSLCFDIKSLLSQWQLRSKLLSYHNSPSCCSWAGSSEAGKMSACVREWVFLCVLMCWSLLSQDWLQTPATSSSSWIWAKTVPPTPGSGTGGTNAPSTHRLCFPRRYLRHEPGSVRGSHSVLFGGKCYEIQSSSRWWSQRWQGAIAR